MNTYFQTLTNSRGDVLPGDRLQVATSGGAAVDIFADDNGTTFTDEDENVVNYATADLNGLVKFYWTPASGQVLQWLDSNGNLRKAIADFASPYLLDEIVGDLPQSRVTDLVDDLATKMAIADLASTASGKGGELVSFIQDGTDAEARDVLVKLRERVSILDYGASEDNTAAQNTTAIHAAMTALMDRFDGEADFYPGGTGDPLDFYGRDRRTGVLFIPAGRYLVSPNVFNGPAHDRAPYVGFTFQGEDRNASVLLLETSGAEAWFFNNSVSLTERYQMLTFADINFRSDDYRYGSFLKMYSTGVMKQVRVVRCEFNNIQHYMHTTGSGNADLCVTENCHGQIFGHVLTLDNSQSVQHDFKSAHFSCHGHMVYVKQNGGGNVNFSQCSMDLTWHEDYSPAAGNFMFAHDANTVIGQGGCTFKWEDCRIEVEAYTTKPGGTATTNTAGYAAGVSSITLAAGGSGAIAIGAEFYIGTDATKYTATSAVADLSAGGAVSFTPVLAATIPALATPLSINPPPFGIAYMPNSTTALPRVILDNVNFVNGQTYTIDGSGETTATDFRRIYAVVAHPRKYIEFRNVVLMKMFFYIVGGPLDTGSPNAGAHLLFENCYDGISSELPTADAALLSLHSRVAYSGAIGRVITRGTSEHVTGLSTARRLLDSDPYWRNQFGREPSSLKKICSFKHRSNGWPLGTGAGSDCTVEIPPGFTALRVYVLKPASGGSTQSYQLHLKATDRSGATIASSTLAQGKDEHSIDLSHVDWSAYSKVCLCASGDYAGFQSGGFAYIEYV
jgi:hypothetical protein